MLFCIHLKANGFQDNQAASRARHGLRGTFTSPTFALCSLKSVFGIILSQSLQLHHANTLSLLCTRTRCRGTWKCFLALSILICCGLGHHTVSLKLLFHEDKPLIAVTRRAITAIGAGFSRIGPRQRPFDITDRSLSYPLESETVTNSTLLIAALIAPAAVILIGSLFVGTGPGRKPSSKAASWRRKLWEWNTGWMGLALSLAIAFIIANGAKEVLGKPRPNLLARCSPDLSKRLEATVGGIGDQIEEGITLYNTKICRNHGAILDEGFRSFPSGHSACRINISQLLIP